MHVCMYVCMHLNLRIENTKEILEYVNRSSSLLAKTFTPRKSFVLILHVY